jgi:uncharacterized protein with NAD-binding domain and iron-sulfur cluster
MSNDEDPGAPGPTTTQPFRTVMQGGVTVAVFGAGIAGLTAAHELAERGFVVTVYEPKDDERPETAFPPGGRPPVKLGGMAASQWARAADSSAQHNVENRQVYRRFPGRAPTSDEPGMLPGEHGFRFFPAYYLHVWDTMQRIPTYEPQVRQVVDQSGTAAVTTAWVPTARTVYDNVQRVITQGTTTPSGVPNIVFAREAPWTLAELASQMEAIGLLGFDHADLAKFGQRLARYLATGPVRRRRDMERMSAYDYMVDPDPVTLQPRIAYSAAFDRQLRDMPKVLAAFDALYGDARTNLDTYLQLQLRLDRRDNKADGVLDGPTSEAWFDHWYHHLLAMGVTFRRGELTTLALDAGTGRIAATVTPPDGSAATTVAADYLVVATDASHAEEVTKGLRAAGVGGTVAGLDGYYSFLPVGTPPSRLPGVPTSPHPTDPTTTPSRRSGYGIDDIGRHAWDRFQTLSGIQYYFDTEFQLVRGHVYFTGSEWGLSSINQSGLWHDQPYPRSPQDRAARTGASWLTGYASVLSVDIGDWRTSSSVLGKPANTCTDDEIATEVWRQMVAALLKDDVADAPNRLPTPAWYTLDRNIVTDATGTVTHNRAPYLVPIVNDWSNRPGGPPWNPHGHSPQMPPTGSAVDRAKQHYWEAAHGGYQVHGGSLVFAGTWTKTFTRMTSMEAANESGRHAVNAILDHYVSTRLGDDRDGSGVHWKIPYGFVDQGGSSPVRQPTPAGDYSFIFDIENREPAEFRATRELDDHLARLGLPHPWETLGIDALGRGNVGGPGSVPTVPHIGDVVAGLQQWRSYLETLLDGSPKPAPTGADAQQQSPSSGAEVVPDGHGLEGRTEVPPVRGGGTFFDAGSRVLRPDGPRVFAPEHRRLGG